MMNGSGLGNSLTVRVYRGKVMLAYWMGWALWWRIVLGTGKKRDKGREE